MSERPREGTQERYIDQWPKPMFLCTYCDEQTDSDPCQECASVFDERGENYPPVLRFQVVPAPAQPEQPRGEGDAGKTRGYTREDIQANTWWPGKGGEEDDLAARLEEKSNVEEGLRPARPTNLPGPDLYHLGRAEAFAEAAQLARASTHPEQWARVDPEQLRLVRNMAKTEASQSDPEQAPAFTDERRASHRRRADALNAVLAALEPASPTPTEQGEDRSIRGCSPSSTRTPPTNAGRRGLAGSTDTNAPRGSCSNEPMPR